MKKVGFKSLLAGLPESVPLLVDTALCIQPARRGHEWVFVVTDVEYRSSYRDFISMRATGEMCQRPIPKRKRGAR